jgi:hypothetical protein
MRLPPAGRGGRSIVDPSSPSIGLAFALGHLAHLRHHMLTELELA